MNTKIIARVNNVDSYLRVTNNLWQSDPFVKRRVLIRKDSGSG